jgi:aryl sulfotransferase
MSRALPTRSRVYQNHHLDSERWHEYSPRDGDIIVTTSYKSGTTWTQSILLSLLHPEVTDPQTSMQQMSPWVDARFVPIPRADLRGILEALPDRRFLKSHLPLDGLPCFENVRYLIVGRDPRDVFMSLLNHYSSYTELAMSMFNSPDRPGEPLPPCPDEPRALWRDWMTRGWFDWESEGYPFWSNLHHTQSYWNYRHLPNFLFLHYADMLADLEGAVRRIARFCEIDVDDAAIARAVEDTTFANVKKRVEAMPAEQDGSGLVFSGGQRTFFFKGTNGRWRNVLTESDLALYEAARERVLTPDCARWLEQGDAAL